jgi:FkbM family methyltransferase
MTAHSGDEALRRLYRNPPFAKARFRQLIHAVLGGRDIEFRNLTWRCYPKDNAVERYLWLDGVTDEEEEIDWLIARLNKQSTFLDVGANCGIYTLSVHSGAGARVVAVEPNPVMRERLIQNMAANQIADVAIEPIAIGEVETSARLHFGSAADFGQASLIAGSSKRGLEVAVRPLSQLVEKYGLFDAIKVDVEGFEDRVLASFLSSAKDALLPSSMVIEHLHQSAWLVDLESLASRRGFALEKRTKNNLLFAR